MTPASPESLFEASAAMLAASSSAREGPLAALSSNLDAVAASTPYNSASNYNLINSHVAQYNSDNVLSANSPCGD